jgi:tetratricopeptide (TPR) repeat protein
MAENPRIEELRRRVEADPASIAFAALAEEYRRLGRYEEAVEICTAGLQRHPAYLSARVTLGRALLETGELDSAREQFQTVLRAAPENIAATRGLAQIHERLGHSTEMDPQLAQLMREHAEGMPPAREPVVAPAAVAAPVAVAAPEPVALAPDPLKPPEPEPEPEPMELHAPLEPSEPSVGLPLAPLAAVPHIEPDIPEIPETLDAPDAAVIAAISHLERLLAAIQHARRA